MIKYSQHLPKNCNMVWKSVYFIGLISIVNCKVINRAINSDFNYWNNLENDVGLIPPDYDNPRGVPNIGEMEKSGKLSEVEWSSYNLREPNGPGTYAFGYDNAVDPANNEHFRSEERLSNGTVIGEYGYTDYENRKIVKVTYTADHRGYRAKTEITSLEDGFV